MQKTLLTSLLLLGVFLLHAQGISIRLKAFERFTISGVAPVPTVEIGDKEIASEMNKLGSDYFIYLFTDHLPDFKIIQVWIKHNPYQTRVKKIAGNFITQNAGNEKNTLTKFANETAWQLTIVGKCKSIAAPKKNLAALIANNDLVITLKSKNEKTYTKTLKHFEVVESERMQ